MNFPWQACSLLAFESADVMRLRLAKIGRGGWAASDEVRLMFSEKALASFEATWAAMSGSTPDRIVERYRDLVAANRSRLAPAE